MWLRFSDEVVWPNFRFGSKTGEPFPDSQFPVAAVNPADRGIRGNSHMIMQDKNNLQIADFILQWIDEQVSTRPAAK